MINSPKWHINYYSAHSWGQAVVKILEKPWLCRNRDFRQWLVGIKIKCHYSFPKLEPSLGVNSIFPFSHVSISIRARQFHQIIFFKFKMTGIVNSQQCWVLTQLVTFIIMKTTTKNEFQFKKCFCWICIFIII